MRIQVDNTDARECVVKSGQVLARVSDSIQNNDTVTDTEIESDITADHLKIGLATRGEQEELLALVREFRDCFALYLG